MDLGGSGPPFGKCWGRSGSSFGHFCALLAPFFGILNQPFFKHRSRMGCKRPFGSILNRFWKILGGFGEGLENVGSISKCFGEDFGNAWHDSALPGRIL